MGTGDKNLIPMISRSKEERKAITRRGGIASGRAKREKKMMGEIAIKMLNSALSAENAGKLKDFKMLGKNDLNYNAAIIATNIINAIKGDVTAAKFLMDVSGQTPTTKQEITGGLDNRNEVVVAKDSITADVYKRLMNGDGE